MEEGTVFEAESEELVEDEDPEGCGRSGCMCRTVKIGWLCLVLMVEAVAFLKEVNVDAKAKVDVVVWDRRCGWTCQASMSWDRSVSALFPVVSRCAMV